MGHERPGATSDDAVKALTTRHFPSRDRISVGPATAGSTRSRAEYVMAAADR